MTNLTPEEINRVLAEWMGWRLCDDASIDGGWVCPNDELWMLCPAFCEDLNAIQGLESKLTDEQLWEYIKQVVEYEQSRYGFPLLSRSESLAFARATALQKATALVRALGLGGKAQ